MPQSQDPPYFIQVVFALSLILGNLMLMLTFAFDLGSGTHHGRDVMLDYGFRAGAIALLLASIFLARKMWGAKRLIPEGAPSILQFVLAITYLEIGFALFGIIRFLTTP
jgi:hypothetical protein